MAKVVFLVGPSFNHRALSFGRITICTSTSWAKFQCRPGHGGGGDLMNSEELDVVFK